MCPWTKSNVSSAGCENWVLMGFSPPLSGVQSCRGRAFCAAEDDEELSGFISFNFTPAKL